MARCLHHPEKGYYSRNIRSIGSRGDFTTAPQLSDAPAKAIAHWFTKASRTHNTRNLIEIGPGLGTLSRQVLENLPLLTRLRTNLHLVESSSPLAEHQKSTLKQKAQYHTDIHSALQACEGKAIIFSNELVDAFPVRIFEKAGNDLWEEIHLDHSGGFPREIRKAIDQLPPSSIFQQNLPHLQRVEVHDSYRTWLSSWLPLWNSGEILTIDYGSTAGDLYSRRPQGSLRAYLLHQRLEGPAVLQNPGLQDITADVNFTDLANWSEPWLDSHPPENLYDFIAPFLENNHTDFAAAASCFLTLRQSPSKSRI